MKLKVYRYSSQSRTTISAIHINGEFECFGLEDRHRDVKVMGKTSFENSAKEKGRGSEIIRYKNGFPYWVLPFRLHDQMTQPNPDDAVVLTAEELNNFDWDIDEIE